jgi:pyroglutamyl-peptidase
LRPLLVTGFEPFGGDTVNPSQEVAIALHGRVFGGVPVVGLALPCRFGASLDALRSAIAAHRPQLVLALGLASGRSELSLERVAINLDDARIADNAGAQPIDTPVVPGAPAALFTTLPVKAMVAAMRAAGHPAGLSLSAGSFVCNHVFYGLLHALRRRRGVRGGFMHLPCLPEQVTAGSDSPALPLHTMVEGVVVALETALATHTDIAQPGGSIA